MAQGPSCPAPRLAKPGKPGSGQPRVATRLKRKDLPGCGASSTQTRACQAGREGLVTRNSWDRRSWRVCSAGRAPGRAGGWLLRGEKGGTPGNHGSPVPPAAKPTAGASGAAAGPGRALHSGRGARLGPPKRLMAQDAGHRSRNAQKRLLRASPRAASGSSSPPL